MPLYIYSREDVSNWEVYSSHWVPTTTVSLLSNDGMSHPTIPSGDCICEVLLVLKQLTRCGSVPTNHNTGKLEVWVVENIWNKLVIAFSSVAQSCPTLCDPMNRSTPGLPVHHQLPDFTQTHVHRISDAIQPSHPLSSPSPPVSNPSQHQSLFQWVNSSHEVAKVLESQL